MKNNDALKKHHFWLLLGVVPLFTLIGVVLVDSSVGGEIDARKKVIETETGNIGKKSKPKPKTLIAEADVLLDKVGKKSDNLWKDNWERQKDLYTWPSGSGLLKEIEARHLKFGDPLPSDRGEFDEFRKNEVYLYEFSSLKKDGTYGGPPGMVDKVAPTQFRNGWQYVLRHVTEFGSGNLNKDQVWLIMEDLWVQRSLLDAIRSVNKEMATFHRAKTDAKGEVLDDLTYDDEGNKIELRPVKNDKGELLKKSDGTPRVVAVKISTPDSEKRKALFHTRTWAVELELVKEGNQQRLTGTLTNLSERLQLLGVGNMMTLHVWFTHSTTEQPTVFRIGEEFLPGKGATKRGPDGKDVPANVLPILPLAEHLLPAGKTATEIVRVEQVFDARTVPIKRIDALALGKTDSRSAALTLLPPASPPFAKEPEAPAVPGGPMTPGGPMGVPMGPPMVALPGRGGDMTMPGGPNGAKGLAGGGPLVTVIDGNKLRYLPEGVTPQVRRMPVGIVVVVDQAYLQDTLLAFANSPLRFQITQVTWTRFRDKLAGIGTSGSTGGPNGDIDYGSGRNNITGYGDPDAMRPSKFRPSGPGMPVGPVGGPGPVGSPGGPMGMGPMGGFGSSGASSIASESQITSGLVELSIYGVVSLYEKYSETPPAAGAPGTPPAGAPQGGMPPAGAPQGGMPPAGTPNTPPGTPPGMPPAGAPVMPPGPAMPPTPPAPGKMRRRIRK